MWRPKAAWDSGTEAAVATKTDLIHRKNVKRFALLRSSTPESLLPWGPKRGWPAAHTSWRRRSQPLQVVSVEALGIDILTLFHFLLWFTLELGRNRSAAWSINMVLNVSVDPTLSVSGQLYRILRTLCNSYPLLVFCEHFYKLILPLESHTLPILGQV